MIESVKIHGIQSHKDTVLKFSPGVNAIIGKSESGKTAIMRAMEWLMQNKIDGSVDDIKSKFSDYQDVNLVVDAHSISRIRSKKENIYELDGQEYSAMGQSVPDDIAKILNISPVNIQNQHDTHFLLSATPGEVARYINEQINLEIIHIAIKNAASYIREKKEEFNISEKGIKQASDELKHYEWLDDAQSDLDLLQVLDNQVSRLEEDIETIERSLSVIEENMVTISSLEWVAEAQNDAASLRSFAEATSVLKDNVASLTVAISEVERNQKQIDVINELLKAKKDLEKIEKLDSEHANLYFEHGELSGMIDKYTLLNTELESLANEIEELHDQFYTEFPDICPLCGKEK